MPPLVRWLAGHTRTRWSWVRGGLVMVATSDGAHRRVGMASLIAVGVLLALASADPLLAGTVGINFQPANAEVPTGYLVDSGAVFGDRGNGFSYGWSADNTDGMVDRDSDLSPDQRFDTFATMPRDLRWEIAVPNGTYTVLIVAGDAKITGGTNLQIRAEGVL